MTRPELAPVALRPFFSYYGGKWRDSPRYPRPQHNRLVEPFAGSAGYAVRNPKLDVVLIDKDPDVCAVWRYLISASPDRILRLPDIATTQSVEELDVSDSERLLIGLWLNSGSAQPKKKPSSWMRSGVRPGSFWGSRVRSTIAAQIPAIRHWTIVEGDYRDSGNEEATWFIDPPYENAGRYYRHGSNAIDYTDLADFCRTRRGQVIVCEACGAGWLDFKSLHSAKRTKPGGRSAESIWTNDRQLA